MRGNVSFLGRQGLPWLYLGTTQSPLLVMCQIADITGVLGITFWIVMLNATIALAIIHRRELRRVTPAIATAVVVLIAICGYGAFRLSQDTSRSGPTVAVVQANYKQSNTGEKGAPVNEIVPFHVNQTRRALSDAVTSGQNVDLVVWSETMMPAINPGATALNERGQAIADAIGSLAKESNTHILAGGIYFGQWRERGDEMIPDDRRNSAYLFLPTGAQSEKRYDKIHLVPFGEYIPFKESIPPLYRLFIHLGPNYYEEYVLTRGTEVTVFDANGFRFVAPICFEDIVGSLVAGMLRGPDGTKRADFLVNITNDGWFRGSQMPQHLQAAVFRSIENRVPTARSVNTGISGFIDSVGRVSNTVQAETEGASVAPLRLDSRVAPYTRIGDAFALTCAGGTLGVVGWMIMTHMRYKRALRHSAAQGKRI
jgi:apolipoprotein N-acyltransferase